MSKTKIIFIASLIFIGTFFYAYYCFCLCRPCIWENSNSQNEINIEIEKKKSDISKVCFNKLQRDENEKILKKCFNVEIADTPETCTYGLMNRKSLNQDNGMLFLFETEAKYCFWMKNTLISLDIIWLDKNKKVVFIKHNAEPCQAEPCETFGPSEKAKYVLEINSGLAKEIGLEKGNYLEFK